MKPFRKNLAIAIDGGGIRGIIPARALSMLEQEMGKSAHEMFRLTAGTSTGSIIAAGIAAGMSAEKINELYLKLGREIFRPSFRTKLWPLFNHRYQREPLENALNEVLKDLKLGDLWTAKPYTDLVVTSFDVIENRTRFFKSWKPEYSDLPLVKAVLASSAAPTYFPSVDGRYIDGGVGSFNNPCYLAAFEIAFFLGNKKRGNEMWKPEETTLISLGTGRTQGDTKVGQIDHYLSIQYIGPILDAFSHSADDQQVFLTKTFFPKLDFRRYQVDMDESIGLDDASQIDKLLAYGDKLGRMLLGNDMDRAMTPPVAGMPKKVGPALKETPAKAKESTSRRQTSKSDSPPKSLSRTPTKSARAPRKRSPA
jgi:hypothetical protein